MRGAFDGKGPQQTACPNSVIGEDKSCIEAARVSEPEPKAALGPTGDQVWRFNILCGLNDDAIDLAGLAGACRSEERRVGKECRL